MSQDTANLDEKAKKLANSAAARGYVQTQQSLYGLVNDLLATVKGLRKHVKEQHEKLEDLTKVVNQQKEEMERLKRRSPGYSSPTPVATDGDGNTSTSSAPTTNPDLSQFRRELVRLIGEALAQHEEEHHENEENKPTEIVTEEASDNATEWKEFRSTILPRYVTRTFYSTGTSLLQGPACSYIDYPMHMALAEGKPQPTKYSWSFQTEGKQWAVGMAVLSKTKWETTDEKVLGDVKGEWALRSDSTLWSHSKLRQTLPDVTATDESLIVTLTLEMHPNKRILLKGTTQQKQAPSVWFDIPWKNFKKPTVFVPAVTVQQGSLVRFRGWES